MRMAQLFAKVGLDKSHTMLVVPDFEDADYQDQIFHESDMEKQEELILKTSNFKVVGGNHRITVSF